MTQESSTRNGGYTNNFAYDGGSYTATTGAGNPTTMRGSSLSYNSDNQISTNTYDGNGNPTTYSGNTLTFDPENRMTGFNSAETNTYDGDDHRASVQTSSGTTYYVFDGDTPMLTEDGTGTVTKVTTIGAAGVASSHATATGFYTWDPQGSLCQKLDSTGSVQYSREYDAFGNVAKTDSDTDSYGSFGGQWGYLCDSSTGLCQLGRRFYDPSTGRFVSRDPISYAGGINVYAYARNAPTQYIDPDGTMIRRPPVPVQCIFFILGLCVNPIDNKPPFPTYEPPPVVITLPNPTKPEEEETTETECIGGLLVTVTIIILIPVGM